MEIIEEFIVACEANKIKKVKKMISEGVDINDLDSDGRTALMKTMGNGRTELVRILLGCNNIKIDTKDVITDRTALHFACYLNQVESVKLFLAHPSCSKDIVRMEDSLGTTAEMWANRQFNQECAKLVREFLEKDDRSVDDLVQFITGEETEKKKKRKKRKTPVQSNSTLSENTGESNSAQINDDNDSKNETNETVGNCDSRASKVDIKIIKHPGIAVFDEDHGNVQNDNDTKHINLIKAQEELKKIIDEKRVQYDAHEQNARDRIAGFESQIKNLGYKVEECQDLKNTKLIKVDILDKELAELERKMSELKRTKADLVEETRNVETDIENYEKQKQKLESQFEKEMKRSKKIGNKMKDEIRDLESKLQGPKILTKNIQNNVNGETLSEPIKEFLKFINNQIIEKEKELECPVCLEVACSPIFMCSEQHLICSTCRQKLSNCPECRVGYRGKQRRHRYAEKTAEELERLKEKKDQVNEYQLLA